MKAALERIIFPAAFYLFVFIVLTYPAITSFSHRLLADTGDGFQNVWNLWWVHKAVIDLHQSPWHTGFLEYPFGVTLVAHTLNPFDGFLGLPLLHFFSLSTTYNIILLFSFVTTGLTAFWLGWELTKSTPAAYLTGSLVTFSSFHFAHAEGHLQLVAMEGIPLFLCLWLRLLQRPNRIEAIGAGLVLGLVILSDYYYYLYCAMSAVILSTCFFAQRRTWPTREDVKAWVLFLIVALVTTGPLMLALLELRTQGVLHGAHSSLFYSLDLQSLFVPGGHWRFASWTEPLWSKWSSNSNETNVYLGWTTLLLAGRGITGTDLILKPFGLAWLVLITFFFVMALGPSLHVGGHPYTVVLLPYGLLERLFPEMKISGCPIRMAVMVNIGVAVFAAAGFKGLLESKSRRPLWSVIVVAGTLLDLWPRPLTTSALVIPEVIRALQKAPSPGGVVDALSTPTEALYYQTIYQKPMALGYISRIPDTVYQEDLEIMALYRAGQWNTLSHRYGLRYFLISPKTALAIKPLARQILYQDPTAMLLDFGA